MVTVGREIIMLFVALGVVQWLTMARIVRGQVLSLKQKEFVEAARMSGTTHTGILFNHLIDQGAMGHSNGCKIGIAAIMAKHLDYITPAMSRQVEQPGLPRLRALGGRPRRGCV